MLVSLESRMIANGFTRVIRGTAITPASLYGVCRTRSLDFIHSEESIDPSIHEPLRTPITDPYSHDQFVFSYLLTDRDFQNSNFLQMARRITAWTSVVLGKLVSDHELIQINTSVLIPPTIPKARILNRELPFYSDSVRTDESVPLNFESLSILEDLVFNTSSKAMLLHSAAQFYADALRWWLRDPEQAYVSLVTTGECLCGLSNYKWLELANPDSVEILTALDRSDSTGKLSKIYRSQTRFIRENFARVLTENIPESVLEKQEYAKDGALRLSPDCIRKAIKHAYDLRSKYVHTGSTFGVYTSVAAARAKAELWNDFSVDAIPIVEAESRGTVQGDILETVTHAATFIGLERVIRAAILQLAKKHRSKFTEENNNRFTGPLPSNRPPLAGRWVRVDK